jgi:hypothetical protein
VLSALDTGPDQTHSFSRKELAMAADNSTTPVETWKPIPEFTGYEASDLGRIRSFWKQETISNGFKGEYRSYLSSESKIIAQRPNKKDRMRANLRHDSGGIRTVMVHHAVLWAFVGQCPEGMVACHDPDRNTANNRLSNLRWDTQQENIRDAGRHGTKKVLSPEQLAEVARLISEGLPACEIADRLNVKRPSITRVVRREGFNTPKKAVTSRFDEELIGRIVRLRQEGLSDRKIGELLGVGKVSIWRHLGPKSSADLT